MNLSGHAHVQTLHGDPTLLLYARVHEGEPARTVEWQGAATLMLDAQGRLIGVAVRGPLPENVTT